MVYWRKAAEQAIIDFVKADPCEPNEIMRIQNDLARADMMQTGLHELIETLEQGDQLGVIEGENAAGDD